MQKKTSTVEIHCDGACLGNPGPGGWAALLLTSKAGKTHEKLVSGAEPFTTNNRMELRAAIEGFNALKRPCNVDVFSDSKYVVRGMSEWVIGWIKNGWRTAAKKPVENQDLWQELVEVSQTHTVTWNWVKGHAGHPLNERVDEAARLEAEGVKCQDT
jgi:ribonuclease HI